MSPAVIDLGGGMDIGENLGTRVLLENERVRIWEHRVPQGATGPMHLHRRPYFSVVVEGSSGNTISPDGNVVEHFTLTPGTVLWYGEDQLPETHALRNTGEGDILIVTTEFL
jgi:beta-alanine degradation protein BauB